MKIAIGVIALLIIFSIIQYNAIVQAKVRVESAWSQIDVQLQRRMDLIGNIVETVKGYANHEKSTLEAVISARAKAVSSSSPAESAANQNMLTQALGKLLMLSEAYPELKANQNFLSLQDELTSTEGRIAYARNYYNESVQIYNTRISSFPSNIYAKMQNATLKEFFITDEASRVAPKVQF
jgi:LemA protein